MRWLIRTENEALAQLRTLAPTPRREVRRALREMEDDPNGPQSRPLRPPLEGLYRVRVGDYRIIFEPGPGHREVTVRRIGHRESVYEGLGRSGEV